MTVHPHPLATPNMNARSAPCEPEIINPHSARCDKSYDAGTALKIFTASDLKEAR